MDLLTKCIKTPAQHDVVFSQDARHKFNVPCIRERDSFLYETILMKLLLVKLPCDAIIMFLKAIPCTYLCECMNQSMMILSQEMC